MGGVVTDSGAPAPEWVPVNHRLLGQDCAYLSIQWSLRDPHLRDQLYFVTLTGPLDVLGTILLVLLLARLPATT
jgi:hypothetical protein